VYVLCILVGGGRAQENTSGAFVCPTPLHQLWCAFHHKYFACKSVYMLLCLIAQAAYVCWTKTKMYTQLYLAVCFKTCLRIHVATCQLLRLLRLFENGHMYCGCVHVLLGE